MRIPEHWLTPEFVAGAEGAPPSGKSIPVFRNAFIDRWLARSHPAVPPVMFGAIAVAALGYAISSIGVGWGLSSFASGWILFSLFEYLLHRFVFHRAFPDTRAGRIEAFMTHGYHHAYPIDPDRLVMPPMATVPLAALFCTAYVLALGLGAGLAAFAGTLVGYTLYDSVHWYVHHGRPTTRIGKWLRSYHLQHHHVGEASRYGVSSPLWDFVFGTFRDVLRAKA